jgi:transketolase
MRDKFFQVLTQHAKKNKNILLLVADIGFGVIDDFKRNNPHQFFNVGISEQNMVGIATGLALSGKKVFCYSIANFTTLRSIEHIRNGPCYHNLDIKFISAGSGYSYGSLGYSHHAIEDLAIMRCLPNLDVFSPCSDHEVEYIANNLIKSHKTPAYLRIDKSKISDLDKIENIKNITLPRKIVTNKNEDVVIFSTGGIIEEVKKAVEKAKKKKVNCSIYSIFNISNLNKSFTKKFINKKILVVEETIKENGVYCFIKEQFKNNNVRCICLNKNDIYFNAGTQSFIREKQKISEKHIFKAIINFSALKL